MRKLVVPAIASVLLVGLALWLMTSGETGYETTRTDRVRTPLDGDQEGDVASEGVLDPSAAGETADADSVAADAASADTDALYGRVTDDAGGGLAGARVWLQVSQDLFSNDWERSRILRDRLLGRAGAGATGTVASAVADAGGYYAIALAAIPQGSYQVLARHDGFVPQWESWARSDGATELNFRLGPGDAITGRVVDPEGKPVEGAAVEAFLEESRRGPPGMRGQTLADRVLTDEEGRFRLGVSGGRYRLSAAARGFSDASADSVDAGTRDLELKLGLARNLAGRVLDGEQKPLAGARVFLLSASFGGRGFGGPGGPGGPGGRGGRGGRGGPGGFRGQMPSRILRLVRAPAATAQSDDEGNFQFDSLSQGAYSVLVEKPGYVPGQESVELGEEKATTDVEVVLADGRTIQGIVKDPDGRPVRGAFIVVGQDTTEDDARRRERMLEFQKRMQERMAQMQSEGRDVSRMAGFMARMGGGAGEGPSRPQALSAFRALEASETDGQGRFRFDTLTEGLFSLSVQSPRFVTYREDGIKLEKDGAPAKLDITLDPGIRLEGKVLSSENDLPVPKARIRLRFGRSDELRAVSGNDGTYSIQGLSPGPVDEIDVQAVHFSRLVIEDVEIAPEPATQPRDFVVDPAARLAGKVTDKDGKPVLNAQVTLAEVVQDDGGGMNWWMARRRQMRLSSRGRTNGDGRFELRDVNPADAVELSISHPDFKRFTSEAFAVQPGDRVDNLNFALSSGARVEVWVRDPDGAPVAGARLTLRREPTPEEAAAQQTPAQQTPGQQAGGGRGRGGPGGGRRGFSPRGQRGRGSSTRTSGPDGKAVFTALDAAGYMLSAAVRGYQPFSSSVIAQEDAVTTAVVDLLAENVITGVVQDRFGAVIAGASVEAYRNPDDGRPFERSWTRSAPEGSFEVGSLGEGPYTLRVRREGFAERRVSDVNVNTQVPVVLERLGGISGWVLTAETSAPVPRFRIGWSSGTNARGRGGRGRGGNRRDFNDPAGAFLLKDLEPGDYTLQVTADGYSGAQLSVTVKDGLVTEGVQVFLYSGVVLTGLVTSAAGGNAVEGAKVFLLAREDNSADRGGRSQGVRRVGGGRTQNQDPASSRRGGGTSRGARGSQENAAAKMASAMIKAAMRGGNALAVTDEGGTFDLRDVPEGRYTLVVDHESLVAATKDVDLRPGRFANPLKIVLQRGEDLEGVVSYEDGTAAAGARVMLRDSGGLSHSAMTDAAGRYRLQGLAKGPYSATVRGAGGLKSTSIDITIKSGTNRFDYHQGDEK